MQCSPGLRIPYFKILTTLSENLKVNFYNIKLVQKNLPPKRVMENNFLKTVHPQESKCFKAMLQLYSMVLSLNSSLGPQLKT